MTIEGEETHIWRWPEGSGARPLDAILGRRVHLRVLRALDKENRPCWPREIAETSRLSRSAVHGALIRLTEWGIIEPDVSWGARRSYPLRLTIGHPLTAALDRLFETESQLRFGVRGERESRWEAVERR